MIDGRINIDDDDWVVIRAFLFSYFKVLFITMTESTVWNQEKKKKGACNELLSQIFLVGYQ